MAWTNLLIFNNTCFIFKIDITLKSMVMDMIPENRIAIIGRIPVKGNGSNYIRWTTYYRSEALSKLMCEKQQTIFLQNLL